MLRFRAISGKLDSKNGIASGSSNLKAEAFCVFIGIVLAFASNFQYGYSTTFLNTPVDEFKNFMNESLSRMGHTMTESSYSTIWNLTLNITFLGLFLGFFLNPLIIDRYGRKVGFLIGNFLSFLSSLFRFASIYFYRLELLILSRILTSFCTAVTYQCLLLYLQECAPTKLRGLLTFLSEIMFATMCMVAMLLGTDELLGNHLLWLTFVAIPPCLVAFVVLFFIPETPKFLLITKKDRKAAIKSVQFFHGNQANVEAVLAEIEQEGCAESEGGSALDRCKDIYREPYLRNAVILSCVCLQNCVGMWSLLFSSTYFLEQANVSSSIAQWSSTAMVVAYIVGALIGATIIDGLGRRPTYLIGTSINVASQVAFVLFDKLQTHLGVLKYGCVVMLVVYGVTYGTAPGPISWFISSELVPQKYRSTVQSISYVVNTVVVIAFSFSVLPLYDCIGSYALIVLYVVPSVFSLLYIYKFLPETKNREIHDIVEELKRNK